MKMMEITCGGATIEYAIYSPGGNDTALVWGDDYAAGAGAGTGTGAGAGTGADTGTGAGGGAMKAINDAILARHPNVEQVGFLSATERRLTMAGGEFCGNATRCACYHYLGGAMGETVVQTAAGPIRCGVDAAGEVWAEIPAPEVTRLADGLYLARFDGISHIVVTEGGPPAVGLVLLRGDGAKGADVSASIDPYVYVRDVGTMMHETACLSGTVAAAAVLASQSAAAAQHAAPFDAAVLASRSADTAVLASQFDASAQHAAPSDAAVLASQSDAAAQHAAPSTLSIAQPSGSATRVRFPQNAAGAVRVSGPIAALC